MTMIDTQMDLEIPAEERWLNKIVPTLLNDKERLIKLGEKLLRDRADLADPYFVLAKDTLDLSDLETLRVGLGEEPCVGAGMALLRETRRMDVQSSKMSQNLMTQLLQKGFRSQDEDLLEAILGEIDLREQIFKTARGEGNAIYLACDSLMDTPVTSKQAKALMRRLVDAQADIHAPCTHVVRRVHAYDFRSALSMAAAGMDVGKPGAKTLIDGLLAAGAKVGNLKYGEDAGSCYLKTHPLAKPRYVQRACEWLWREGVSRWKRHQRNKQNQAPWVRA